MGYLFCELMCLGLTGILPDLMSSSIKNLFLSSPGMTTECKPVRGSFPYGGRFIFFITGHRSKFLCDCKLFYTEASLYICLVNAC